MECIGWGEIMAGSLQDLAAMRLLGAWCRGRNWSLVWSKDLANRTVKFEIFNSGRLMMVGLVDPRSRDGFHIEFLKGQISLTIHSTAALEQVLAESFPELPSDVYGVALEDSKPNLGLHDVTVAVNGPAFYSVPQLKDWTLPQLSKLRDDLNAIIYDKERGK